MRNGSGSNLAKGMIAGAVGGLVASWFMKVLIESARQKQQEAVETDQPVQPDESKAVAMMKPAHSALQVVHGDGPLSVGEKKMGDPTVHYIFGTIMGGLYGAAAEYSRVARLGNGTLFGAALFTGTDMVAVPALDLPAASGEAPVSSLTTPYAAHLVYGAITEFVRRLVRGLL